MADSNVGLGLCVVVVGDPSGELVQTAMRLAREAEIDTVSCDDVYAAVAHMAQAADGRLLVAGTIQEFTRENGSFLRLAAAHAVPCCCLLDQAGPAGRQDKPPGARSRWATQDLLEAVRAGVTVLSDVQDLRGVLEKWLVTAQRQDAPRAGREMSQDQRRARNAGDTSYEDLRATEAELSALLR
jgi:hypothetical protein